MAIDLTNLPVKKNVASKGIDLSNLPIKKPVPSMVTSEYWTGTTENIIPSAIETGKAILQPLTHPIETAKAVGTLTKDVATNLGKDVLGIKRLDKNTADILGETLRDRYGNLENIKRTLYTDPVGLAMDVSTIVNPTLKLAGTTTKVGKLGIPKGVVSSSIKNVEKLGNPAFATEKALTYIPKVAAKFARKDLAGITDVTSRTIKRLGSERVFDPIKSKADYIGQVVVPKIQKKVSLDIKTLSPNMNNTLRNIGLSHDDVQIIKKLGDEKRSMIGDIVEGKIDDVMSTIQQQKDVASNFFRETLDSIPENSYFKINNTIDNLDNELKKIGWINKEGKTIVGAGIPNKTKRNIIKIYNNLKSSKQVSPTEYYNTLSELDASTSGVPSFDRIIRQTQKNLREDVVSNFPQLKEANRVYAEAIKVEEIAKSLEKLSEGNVKVPLANSIESKLNNLRAGGKYSARKQWRKLLGKELYDDVLAHWANRNWELISSIPGTGEQLYPTMGRFIQKGALQGSKAYYKNVYPITKDTEKILKKRQGLYQTLYQTGKITKEEK